MPRSSPRIYTRYLRGAPLGDAGRDSYNRGWRGPLRDSGDKLAKAAAKARQALEEANAFKYRTGVDHDMFRFGFMLIECRNLPRLRDYLEAVQYRLVEKFNEHDYLFADRSAQP